MAEKVLILGANGFLGSHVVDSVVAEGFEVRAFDRYLDINDTRFNQTSGIEVYSGDFLNQSDIEDALKDVSYVIHLISMTNPVTAESDPLMDIDTNIRGSVQLFQQIVKLKTIKKIVYSSSGGTVYGEHDIQVPILETERTWPVSPYGIGKSAIENYLHYFNKKFAQPYTVFRIANPYGPRQPIFRKQGVIPIFADKIQNNQVIDIFGDGSMIRDYIYVKDVADAIAKSLTKDLEHSIYNIGSGTGHTITEIIDVLEKTLYTKAEKNYLESPSTFVHYSVLDHSRFTNEFPEIKLTTLEDGISKMIDSEKSV